MTTTTATKLLFHERSLRGYATRQVLRWAGVGLAVSALFSVLIVMYVGVVSDETRIQMISRAALKAFRPVILGGEVKNAELQIRDAFQLTSGESVIVRDPMLKPYYTLGEDSLAQGNEPSCRSPGGICWYLERRQISTMLPIYYDTAEKELFGYLEINVKPHVNFGLLGFLFFVLCSGFIIQAVGLSAKLIGMNRAVGEKLKAWASHIRAHPKADAPMGGVPFSELAPMHAALEGLQSEILRLEQVASDEAKLSMIRGIAHDILSPVSQIKKFFAVLIDDEDDLDPSKKEIITGIRRSIDRLTYLARQTKLLRHEDSNEIQAGMDPTFTWNIGSELSALLGEISNADETKERGVKLLYRDTGLDASSCVRIRKGDFQRILDNLVRNAVQASLPGQSVEVIVESSPTMTRIRVKDTGVGIPTQHQPKIFDLDFTTKTGSGTGLGLAIVKQLCERNFATIKFSSVPGTGTEFEVCFKPSRTFEEVSAV